MVRLTFPQAYLPSPKVLGTFGLLLRHADPSSRGSARRRMRRPHDRTPLEERLKMPAPIVNAAAAEPARGACRRASLLRLCLGAALAWAGLSLPDASAHAQGQTKGWYFGAEGGWSHLQDLNFNDSGGSFDAKPNQGFAAGGVIGYHFGRVRLEGEAVYRSHGMQTLSFSNVPPSLQSGFGIPASGSAPLSGDVASIGFMANAIYEVFPHSVVTPYVGAGIGGADLQINSIRVGSVQIASGGSFQFAYQGIAGLEVAMGRSWSASVDYRYFATTDGTFSDSLGNRFKIPYSTHNVMMGVAYHFGAPSAPPAVPAAIPAPPPPPLSAPRVFLVFFEFDKASLTADGARVVQDAAGTYEAGGAARVMVTGYTDLSGSQQYNLGLSKRRAETVQGALVRNGVPGNAIAVAWRGKEDPRVPTPDGVREPQNRRVEIVMP
jgi:outer membrane protein OmpA-like peptidoglycan-associated protein